MNKNITIKFGKSFIIFGTSLEPCKLALQLRFKIDAHTNAVENINSLGLLN